MPCDDSTSEIILTIDKSQQLIAYDYEKITCGKNVGINNSFQKFCLGKVIDDLSEITFEEVKNVCPIESREDEFLLYLEWKAIREALREYLGKERGPDANRYKMAEIIAEKNCTILKMLIEPPVDMPEIIPCGDAILH